MLPALLLAAACSRPGPPVVALLTVDTWRLDHLDRGHTPHLAALAGRSERFDNAWSPVGLTTPAHATMLTGLPPWRHGMRGNNHHGYALRPDVETLPERFPGWASAAFVSAWPAGPGLERGWEVFDAPEAGERPGGVAVERALAWLRAERDRPALLWVHVYEPHGPYEGEGATERERYAEEVARADALLAPLLDELVRRRATIVVAADHGEVLDEETCAWQHERSSSEAVLHVPLFRWRPDARPSRNDALVGLADVPALLAGDDPAPRDAWLAESGMCEADCAPGCAPEGLAGRDRVVVAPDGSRWVRRGPRTFAVGHPDPALHPLLDAIPPVPAPSAPDAPAMGAALGYVEP